MNATNSADVVTVDPTGVTTITGVVPATTPAPGEVKIGGGQVQAQGTVTAAEVVIGRTSQAVGAQVVRGDDPRMAPTKEWRSETPGNYSVPIPAGVNRAFAIVSGGGGGGGGQSPSYGAGGNGGAGGLIAVIIPIKPEGESLSVVVGAGGGKGGPPVNGDRRTAGGGGGGGASQVIAFAGSVTAGGGGGGGGGADDQNPPSNGGAGGIAGAPGQSGYAAASGGLADAGGVAGPGGRSGGNGGNGLILNAENFPLAPTYILGAGLSRPTTGGVLGTGAPISQAAISGGNGLVVIYW